MSIVKDNEQHTKCLTHESISLVPIFNTNENVYSANTAISRFTPKEQRIRIDHFAFRRLGTRKFAYPFPDHFPDDLKNFTEVWFLLATEVSRSRSHKSAYRRSES